MILFSLVLPMISFFYSCGKSDDMNTRGDCEQSIYIDTLKYNNGPFSNETTISNIELKDDCLNVTFQYGGGCIEDHLIELVWNGSMALSLPPQIWVKIVHDDQDFCEALITKTVSYDISEISDGPFIINFETTDTTLLIE